MCFHVLHHGRQGIEPFLYQVRYGPPIGTKDLLWRDFVIEKEIQHRLQRLRMGLERQSRERLEPLCRILLEPYVAKVIQKLFFKIYDLPQIFAIFQGFQGHLTQIRLRITATFI